MHMMDDVMTIFLVIVRFTPSFLYKQIINLVSFYVHGSNLINIFQMKFCKSCHTSRNKWRIFYAQSAHYLIMILQLPLWV